MKNYSYFLTIGLLCALFFVSCSVEEIDETNFDVDQTLSSERHSKSKKGNSKIEICHYIESTNSYNRISISINGLNGHKNHKNDILVFDNDGDGYPAKNECGINFRDDGLWDLDDHDPTIQDEIDCFSHIVGHYSALKYQEDKYQEDKGILFKLDFTVSKVDDEYFIDGSLTQTNKVGESIIGEKEYDLDLNIHSVNEMYARFYSFNYDDSNPFDDSNINSGSGYYSCDIITIMIGISGSGIPGLQAFYAVKTN